MLADLQNKPFTGSVISRTRLDESGDARSSCLRTAVMPRLDVTVAIQTP